MAQSKEARHLLSVSVRSVYQLQKLRIQMGNRVVASFREKYINNMPPEEVQEVADFESMTDKEKQKLYDKILGSLTQEYTRITDAIIQDFSERNKQVVGVDGELSLAAKKKLESEKLYEGNSLITHRAEYSLVNGYIRTLRTEVLQFKDIEKQLQEFPIYNEFLKDVRGIGPALSAVIIAYFDIEKSVYPTTMLAYCGIDVGPDGRGRGKYKEHLVKREYTDKNGELKIKDSITYEPFLKSKMLGVLATSFLRSASPYRNAYDNYKHRIESRPVPEGAEPLSKAHVHNMALRYMVKIFIIDLYKKWRTLEGLPVAPSYEEAKLGMGEHHTSTVNDIGIRSHIIPDDLGYPT